MSRKLGEFLIEKGIIDPTQLKRALDVQLIYGGHLGTCLVELGFADVDELGQVLSEQFRVGHAAREKLQAIDPSVIALIPARLADRHQVVPFDLVERLLHVAIVDPRNLLALDEVAFVSGHRVEAWIAPEILVHRALERYYGVPRKLRHITVSGALEAAGPAPHRPRARRAAPREQPPAQFEAAAHETPPLAEEQPAVHGDEAAGPAARRPAAAPAEPVTAVAQPAAAEPEPAAAREESVSPEAALLARLDGFVEQARPRAHLQAERGTADADQRSLGWIKHEQDGQQSWCELYSVPLEHEHFHHLGGVYVIWHAGHHPVLRVGQGYIKTELTTLRLDPRLASMNEESRVFVTWAVAPRDERDGIERFLADMLDPEIPGRPQEVEPIAVNLPC